MWMVRVIAIMVVMARISTPIDISLHGDGDGDGDGDGKP